MDNELQNRFLATVKDLKLQFPVAEIQEKTGYGSVVSEYLSSKKTVSKSFLRKFCEVFDLDFDEIYSGKGKKIKKEWRIEAEIIELKAYNKSLILNLSKLMARVDPSKSADKHYDDLMNDKRFFEKDLIDKLE